MLHVLSVACLAACVTVAVAEAAPSTADPELQGAAVWDFVVAGAGTGGALCAGRLAAAGASVLLLEAGPWDYPELYGFGARNVPANVWAYVAQLPSPLTVQNDPDMRERITAGKLMGGSSAIHGDVYDRPSDREFAYGGMRMWDEAKVQAAFSRIEEDLQLTWVGEEDLDAVADAQFWVIDKLVASMPLVHHRRAPRGTAKGGLSVGWWMFRSCTRGLKDCRRHTSYSDFVSSRNSSHLEAGITVLNGALVARVLLEQDVAVGVEVLRGGALHEAFARHGVVLAAGTLGTPKILTLSGIGDPLELQRLGVPVRIANREVGQNLADHLATYTWFMIKGAEDLLNSSDNCAHGEKFNIFFNTSGPAMGGDGPVDAEIRFFTDCNHSRGTIDFGVEAVLLAPDSRGRVRVHSARAQDPPAAEFPALWESDYQRLEDVLLHLGKALGMAPQDLAAHHGESLSQSVRSHSYLYQHFCCSARAAPADHPGVCDEDLRVRGTRGLYVADASALPFPPGAHTSAPVLLMAELAAASAVAAFRSSRGQASPPRAVEAAPGARAALLRATSMGTSAPAVPVADLRVATGAEQVQLPLVGLGTGTMRPHQVAVAVAAFLRLGGRHLDTAVMYDNCAAIRAGIQASAVSNVSDLVITFKMMPLGHESVRSAIAVALAALGRRRLEVALLHWPGDVRKGKLLHGAPLPPCVDAESGSWQRCRRESYAALLEEQRLGRVGAVGVSNFGLQHLDDLAEFGHDPPAVHQLEFHPHWRDDDVLARAERDGTQVQAYGCLGGKHTGATLLRMEGFKKIAARKNITPAQVLLRWGVQQGVSVISGASSEAHLEENLRLFHFSLAEFEMEFMSSVTRENMKKMYGPEPSEIP